MQIINRKNNILWKKTDLRRLAPDLLNAPFDVEYKRSWERKLEHGYDVYEGCEYCNKELTIYKDGFVCGCDCLLGTEKGNIIDFLEARGIVGIDNIEKYLIENYPEYIDISDYSLIDNNKTVCLFLAAEYLADNGIKLSVAARILLGILVKHKHKIKNDVKISNKEIGHIFNISDRQATRYMNELVAAELIAEVKRTPRTVQLTNKTVLLFNRCKHKFESCIVLSIMPKIFKIGIAPPDHIIFSYILSMVIQNKEPFMSNAYFAKLLGKGESAIEKNINSLYSYELIKSDCERYRAEGSFKTKRQLNLNLATLRNLLS